MARQTVGLKDFQDPNIKKSVDKLNGNNNEKGNPAEKVLFQMRLTAADRNEMKAFFAQYGLGTSDGLKKCFTFARQQIENGHAGINGGGIYAK